MNLKTISIKDFGWRCLMTFMMIVPLYYNSMQFHGYMTMRMGQEQAYELGITVLFAIIFVENLWLALFLVWSSFIYAYYNFPGIGGGYVMHIFQACMLYQLTYHLVNRKRVETIFKLILVLCAINLIFTVLQIVGYDPIYLNYSTGVMNFDPVGVMGLKAISGVFSAICIPIALYFSPWLVIAIVPALILSDCSSAVAATVVSILFLAYQQSRKLFTYLLIPVAMAGCLYFAHDSKMNMMSDRVNLWKESAKDAFTRPIVGMGLDSFRNIGALKPFLYFKNNVDNTALRMKYHQDENRWFPMSQTPPKLSKDGVLYVDPWDNPHNEFVGLFYEFGLVGFLIMMALCADVVKRLYRDPVVATIFAVFLVYLVSSIGQFPFHLARTAHFSVILLACYYKLTDKGEDRCLLSR